MRSGALKLFAVAAAFIGLLPATVLAQTGPSERTPKRGGTLVTIIQPEPTVLTTTVNNQFSNGAVSVNIYDGLVAYDDNLGLKPALAESWEISPDKLTLTFHLRHDVKWHDGAPFTSADVRFSALEIWKKVHSRGRLTFAELEDVETPDAYTAIFRFRAPSLVVLSALNAWEGQVLPKHLYENTDILKNPHNVEPVGTGPFKFKSWTKGEAIELERNADYWDAGKPYLDRVIYRFIPDGGARAAAIEIGDVGYAAFDPVPFADIERVRKLPNLKVESRGYEWNAKYYFLEFNLRNPILADIRVRRAFAHAIDRQGLADTVWFGLVTPATGPIPSFTKAFYTADVPTYAFDPKEAERLLDEAGYKRGANGVRFSINQDFQPFNENFRKTAEYIRQNLKRVGVEVNVRSQDLGAFVRRVYGSYDFDINTGQFSVFIDPELGLLRQFWSKSIAPGIPWTNASSYADPGTDKVIEGIKSAADPEQRVALFHELQRRVQRDLPVLPLLELKQFTVYNTNVRGVSVRPDGAMSSLKDIWLAE
ncbi:ABC transporter substrate-binding protein [Xanthobacter agilis]|uniref:Peptide/nickel transport system substrate-binding protein n=1 Tax=Xanthobacter agilis TaxID=47492 RepID=A0ABU0LI74_XANAG|nr:ABC transporter substrate-binding protein [Xanthobacter agilis]MDQ0506844.1 peptide/nickel transport system substrate-binding protein [Xanthobacter agilis]